MLTGLAMARPSTAETTFQLAGEGASRPVQLKVTCGKTVIAKAEGIGELKIVGVPHRSGAHCAAHFYGPFEASFAPVVPGWDYECRILDNDVYCNAFVHTVEPDAPEPAPKPKLVAQVAPIARGEAGPISVSLSEPDLAQWGLLVCPSGVNLKALFNHGNAVFEDVPDEDCVLSIKGGRPGRFSGARPGDQISCSPAGQVLRCHYPLGNAAISDPTPASVRPTPHRHPPVKTAGGDQLVVRLTDPTLSSWLSIQCPGGYRARADFIAGQAVLEEVPDEKCTVSFKGGSPARFDGVTRGMSLQCTLSGTVADCSQ